MPKTTKILAIILFLVIAGFGIGIYLQDLKHKESTAAAWKANRFNIGRFSKIMNYNAQMNDANWQMMQDSIGQQFDSLIILRFRKEMDSLNSKKKKEN